MRKGGGIEIALQCPLAGIEPRMTDQIRAQSTRRKTVSGIYRIVHGEHRARLKIDIGAQLPSAWKFIHARQQEMMRYVGAAARLVEAPVVLIHVAAGIAKFISGCRVVEQL